MKNIGIGIVGCGGRIIGVTRRTCRQDQRLKVIGAHDFNPVSIERARSFFSQKDYYAHADEELEAFETKEALAADPRVVWVMVGSWNNAHCEHTLAAFKAGKHVFCEKPLATSLEDCLKMRDAWRASGKQFVIGFTLRFSPHYRKIKQLIDEGLIGETISMEFNETLSFDHGGWFHDDWRSERRYGGPALLEKCCHDIDLVNWMVGSRTRRVASFGGLDFFVPKNECHMERLGTRENGKQAYMGMGGHMKPGSNPFIRNPKDIVDNQVVIMEYDNNVRATFHTNHNAGIPERRMYILGSEGAIRADVLAGTIEFQRIGFDAEMVSHDTTASGGHGGGDDVMAAELKDCMLHGIPPAAGIEEGLASAVTCLGIDQAMTTGSVVDMTPFWAKVDG